MNGSVRCWGGWLLPCVVVGLSGCANFFPALDNSGSGGNTGGNSGAVTGSGPNTVYVVNLTTQTIYGFTLGTSGLTAVNGLSLGYTPLAVVVSRTGKSLYVAGPGTVNRYAIDTTTGALSVPSAGGAVALNTDVSLDVSPDGKWLLGLNTPSNQVDLYQINSDESLTVASSQPYSVVSGTVVPKQIRVAPSGAYVFAALGTAGEIVMSFNTTSGALGQTQALPTGSTQTADNAIAVDPTSTYLYVARGGTNAGLGVFTIGAQGALASISGSPFAIGTGSSSVAVSPKGTTVYVANRTDGTISEFTVGTGGALTAVSGSPVAAGSLVSSLGVDSTGTYLLAASYGGSPDLAVYSFDATTAGKLNPLGSTAVGTEPAGSSYVALTH